MRRGSSGSGRLRSAAKRPSASSAAQLIERQLQRAEAARLQALADELILALRVVDGDASAGDDVQAVLGRELQERAAERNITARICAAESFSVK